MSIRRTLSLAALSIMALSASLPALAQSADEGTPSLRYMLKAPILFTPGSTGGNTGGGDTGGGEGPGGIGGNNDALTISLPSTAVDWATVGDNPSATLGGLLIEGGSGSGYVLSDPDNRLPSGLNIQGLAIGGFYSTADTYDFALRATDGAGTEPADRAFRIYVENDLDIEDYDQSVYQATTGVQFSLAAPVAEGGKPPYAYQPLTNGIAVDPATGALSWTPTTAGTTPPFRLDVKDARLRPAHTNDIQVNVSSPLTAAYPQASYTLRVNTAASIPAPTVIGGRNATKTPGGTAPVGMTVGTDGSASGVPTEAGAGVLTLSANDADGRSSLASASWQTVPAMTVSGVSSSYAGTVQEAFSGIAPAANNPVGTVSWSLSGSLPDGLGFNNSNGSISGTFASTATTRSGLIITATDALGSASTTPFSINVSTDILATVAANTQNIVLPGTYFTNDQWTSTVSKRLLIPAGVNVYSLSTGSPALTTGTGYGGSLTIEVRGNVYGAGGATSGANGGTAILASTSTVSIQNHGVIKGGGGAGGQGGKGGDAGGWSTSGATDSRAYSSSPAYYCYRDGDKTKPITSMYWNGTSLGGLGGVAGISRDITTGPGSPYRYSCSSSVSLYYIGINRQLLVYNTTGTGGTGGSGGRGESFGQSAGIGINGGVGSGTAGSGGKGGDGGAFGLTGAKGATGNGSSNQGGATGSDGGQPGASVQGASNYTGSGVRVP